MWFSAPHCRQSVGSAPSILQRLRPAESEGGGLGGCRHRAAQPPQHTGRGGRERTSDRLGGTHRGGRWGHGGASGLTFRGAGDALHPSPFCFFLFLEKVLGQNCPDDASPARAAWKAGTPCRAQGEPDPGSPGSAWRQEERRNGLRSGATWGRAHRRVPTLSTARPGPAPNPLRALWEVGRAPSCLPGLHPHFSDDPTVQDPRAPSRGLSHVHNSHVHPPTHAHTHTCTLPHALSHTSTLTWPLTCTHIHTCTLTWSLTCAQFSCTASHTCRHSHIHTHVASHTCTHSHMHTHVASHTCTCSHMHTCVAFHTRTHVHTHVASLTCTHSCAHSYSLTCAHTHVYAHMHTHVVSHTCTHKDVLSLTHVHTLVYTFTSACSHSHDHTLSPHSPPYPLSRKSQRRKHTAPSSPHPRGSIASRQVPPGQTGCSPGAAGTPIGEVGKAEAEGTAQGAASHCALALPLAGTARGPNEGAALSPPGAGI